MKFEICMLRNVCHFIVVFANPILSDLTGLRTMNVHVCVCVCVCVYICVYKYIRERADVVKPTFSFAEQ